MFSCVYWIWSLPLNIGVHQSRGWRRFVSIVCLGNGQPRGFGFIVSYDRVWRMLISLDYGSSNVPCCMPDSIFRENFGWIKNPVYKRNASYKWTWLSPFIENKHARPLLRINMLGEIFTFPLMGQVLLVIFIFIYLLKQWTTRRRILHMGGYAPRIPSCLPLGMSPYLQFANLWH